MAINKNGKIKTNRIFERDLGYKVIITGKRVKEIEQEKLKDREN